jgi:hypothetical protein
MMKAALMMEAARTSETLVNFCQTTKRYNPEDSHLRTHRRENLKSYLIKTVFPTLPYTTPYLIPNLTSGTIHVGFIKLYRTDFEIH